MIHVEKLTKIYSVAKKSKETRGFIISFRNLLSMKKEKHIAVDSVSFDIKEGEIVGYIGNNGAGKSTTIKVMTGIMVPTSGKCIVNGIEPYKNRKENAQNIGVVFGQRTQLWWDLPLVETYLILKELYQVSDAEYFERMNYLQDILELDTFINSPVRTLSLGQRMRADLAAALLHNPKILYLDEPTIGLDVLVKEKIRKAIIEINQKYNTTIILTTHDLEDIEKLCDRVIVIDKGRKVYDGTLNDMKEKYNSKVVMEFQIEENQMVYSEICDLIDIDETSNLKIKGNVISFEICPVERNISGVIVAMAQKYNIKHIAVKEKSISDIVKDIYENGII